MQASDKKQFAEIMISVAEIYEKEMSQIKLRVYFDSLSSLSIEQVNEGVNKHLRDPQSGSFMPKPSDILKHVQASDKDVQSELESMAQMQWLNVQHAIGKCGRYKTPNFKDPYTRAAVTAMGGWTKLCDTNESELTWRGKEFVRNYQAMSVKPIEQLPNNVQGLEDLQKAKADGASALAMIQKRLQETRKGQ